MLNGRLAAGLTHVFSRFYLDGYLHRYVNADDGTGSIDRQLDVSFPVKVQIDRAGQRAQAQGYVEGDATILILNQNIEGDVRDDDEVTVGVETWKLIGPEVDPTRSHWRARGRRKPQ